MVQARLAGFFAGALTVMALWQSDWSLLFIGIVVLVAEACGAFGQRW